MWGNWPPNFNCVDHFNLRLIREFESRSTGIENNDPSVAFALERCEFNEPERVSVEPDCLIEVVSSNNDSKLADCRIGCFAHDCYRKP